MFTQVTVSKSIRRAGIGIAALASCMIAATAGADSKIHVKDRLPSVVVRYGDLDISTESGARALYARLGTAARRVCPDDNSYDLRMLQTVRACRQQAIDRAVTNLNSTALAAVHYKHVTSG